MNRPTFKHVQKGEKPSAKEYNKLVDLVSAIGSSVFTEGFTDSSGFHTRRIPTGLAEATRCYARIIQTLQRPDPTTDPVTEAITSYKIKLLSETVYDEWNFTQPVYNKGAKVVYAGLDYEAVVKITRNSEAMNPVVATSWWTCISPDAYVLGYQYDRDLLGTAPWFQIDDVVEVVQLTEYDGHNQIISGTEEWYIHETIIKVEEVDDDQLHCSQSWNSIQTRAMAVYR